MTAITAIHLDDEEGRISALRRYELLDSAPEAEFDTIIQLIMNIFKVEIAAISLIDTDRQWFKSSQGMLTPETPRSVAFCDYTIRSAEVFSVEDAMRDPRFRNHEWVTPADGLRCYLGAPLTTPDGYNVGSVCIAGREPRHFSSADRDVLQSFARLVVSQMELRLIAKRDSLTDALSRRGFEDAVTESFIDFQKTETPASVAILDLDHFKAVNDTYGHGIGDSVLRAMVEAAGLVLRRTDVVGRIGGEEFGVLMRGTTVEAALQVAERVRSAVEALRFPELPELRVTASIGVAACTPDDSQPDMWLEAADRALYLAKQGGRNRVVRG
ncbi:MAG: sensor domain-containing diguanylate cyclase [Cereibacter changlensis]